MLSEFHDFVENRVAEVLKEHAEEMLTLMHFQWKTFHLLRLGPPESSALLGPP